MELCQFGAIIALSVTTWLALAGLALSELEHLEANKGEGNLERILRGRNYF